MFKNNQHTKLYGSDRFRGTIEMFKAYRYFVKIIFSTLLLLSFLFPQMTQGEEKPRGEFLGLVETPTEILIIMKNGKGIPIKRSPKIKIKRLKNTDKAGTFEIYQIENNIHVITFYFKLQPSRR